MGFRLCRMLFLTTAGALSAQPNEWYDFIRQLDTSANSLDVDRVEKNAEWIVKYLGKPWQRVAQRFGTTFVMPSFVDGGRLRFLNTPWKCKGGKVTIFDNAGYCSASNVISYDGFFLAGIGKKVAKLNHSPGDFATILTLGHETGHALQFQLGIESLFDFPNEQFADCFAGVMTYYLGIDDLLHPNDVEEAKATLTLFAIAGGNKKAAPSDKGAHGNAEQRVEAFMLGYRSGEKGCLWYQPVPPWRLPRPPFSRF